MVKFKLIFILLFLQVTVFAQQNNPAAQIYQLEQRNSQLEEIVRDLNEKYDTLLQSINNEKKALDNFNQRLLLLETNNRLQQQSQSENNTIPSTTPYSKVIVPPSIGAQSAVSNSAKPIVPNNSLKPDAQINSAKPESNNSNNQKIVVSSTSDTNSAIPNDVALLNNFAKSDESLSGGALFTTSTTYRNIGQFVKSRAYLEKFRQKFAGDSNYKLSFFYSGLNSADQKDFTNCEKFLLFYLKIETGSSEAKNLELAKWQLSNCFIANNKSNDAKLWLNELAKSPTSKFKAEAQKLLAKIN